MTSATNGTVSIYEDGFNVLDSHYKPTFRILIGIVVISRMEISILS